MARFSPIAPIRLLEDLLSKNMLGDYLLLLAHDVLDHPGSYADLILSCETKPFIMMDNSVIELGKPLSVDYIIAAADTVGADCIVGPDVIGDYLGTRKRVEECWDELKGYGFPVMKLIQGASSTELVECVKWMSQAMQQDNKDADYWGVPRWVANHLKSRMPITQFINAFAKKPKIHLFGMSKNFGDDIRCAQLPNVMGIDSANPLVQGQKGIRVSTSEYKHTNRGDYWMNIRATPETITNINDIRKLIA